MRMMAGRAFGKCGGLYAMCAYSRLSASQHQVGSMKVGFVTVLSPPLGIMDTRELKQM